jgi:predicted transcriptional regulator
MTKNITVGIPDELSKRMDELTDVNWSAVTRECIEQYIKQRTAGDLEPIIAKVKQKRGDEFKKGYEFVIRNIDTLELPELEEIAHLDANRAERLYYIVHSRPVPNEMLIENLFDITRDPVMGTIIEFIVSSEFLKGMQEAAKEIIEKSN